VHGLLTYRSASIICGKSFWHQRSQPIVQSWCRFGWEDLTLKSLVKTKQAKSWLDVLGLATQQFDGMG
jgi:hypothetical protein